MNARPWLARPAVPYAMAFLAGAVLADGFSIALRVWTVLLVVAVVSTVLARRSTPNLWRGALVVLLFAAGGWRFAGVEARADERVSRWLAPDGSTLEVHFEGRVLRAPEVTWAGEHLLVVRGRPETAAGDRSTGSPEAPGEPRSRPSQPLVVRLRVRDSPEDAKAALEQLAGGDRVRVWCRLRLPRSRGNPASRDAVRALRARGLDAYGTVKSARLVERREPGPPGPLRSIDLLKRRLRRRLDRAFGQAGPTRAVVGAMLLGDRAAVDPSLWRIFRDSGLIHLLAISGLHVGLVALMLIGLLHRVRARPLALLILAALAFAILALLVGARPPVLRAVTTAGMLLGGRTFGRDGEPLNMLAVVAATLVAFDPWMIGSPAFQLSFLATAGILVMTDSLRRALPVVYPLAAGLAISTAAYLATAPVAAWHFARLAPVALLTNLGAVPLCAGILCGGAGAAIFVGAPVVGEVFIAATEFFVRVLLALGSAGASLPRAAFAVPRPAPLLLGGYTALLVAAAVRAGRFGGRPASRCARLGVAVCLVLLHLGPPPPGPGVPTEISVVDVGQAQAVILRGPEGGFLLVDAGGTAGGRFDAGERVVGPLLKSLNCRRIDVLLLTHEHDDHAGGAVAILREFEVGEIWVTPGWHRSSRIRRLVDLARRKRTAIVLVERGHRRVKAGLELEVLHPTRWNTGLRTNDRSLVLRAGRAPARALIPGDLERAGERALLDGGAELAAEALIVGHHGAHESTTDAWLDEVRPEIAVISVGAGNRFGHPDPEVVERLARRGIRTFRTDRHGMVRLRVRSTRWSVDPHRSLGACPRNRVSDFLRRNTRTGG